MNPQTTEQAIAEIWKLFKETSTQIKENDAKLNDKFAKTDAEIEKTTKNLQRLEGLFGNQWGRLLEALVRPGVLKLFQERGHGRRSSFHILQLLI